MGNPPTSRLDNLQKEETSIVLSEVPNRYQYFSTIRGFRRLEYPKVHHRCPLGRRSKRPTRFITETRRDEDTYQVLLPKRGKLPGTPYRGVLGPCDLGPFVLFPFLRTDSYSSEGGLTPDCLLSFSLNGSGRCLSSGTLD